MLIGIASNVGALLASGGASLDHMGGVNSFVNEESVIDSSASISGVSSAMFAVCNAGGRVSGCGRSGSNSLESIFSDSALSSVSLREDTAVREESGTNSGISTIGGGGFTSGGPLSSRASSGSCGTSNTIVTSPAVSGSVGNGQISSGFAVFTSSAISTGSYGIGSTSANSFTGSASSADSGGGGCGLSCQCKPFQTGISTFGGIN